MSTKRPVVCFIAVLRNHQPACGLERQPDTIKEDWMLMTLCPHSCFFLLLGPKAGVKSDSGYCHVCGKSCFNLRFSFKVPTTSLNNGGFKDPISRVTIRIVSQQLTLTAQMNLLYNKSHQSSSLLENMMEIKKLCLFNESMREILPSSNQSTRNWWFDVFVCCLFLVSWVERTLQWTSNVHSF